MNPPVWHVGHCVLSVNHLQLMHDDVYTECTWKSLYTKDSRPKVIPQQLRNRDTGQDDVDHTDQLRVYRTGQCRDTGFAMAADGIKLTITCTQLDCL